MTSQRRAWGSSTKPSTVNSSGLLGANDDEQLTRYATEHVNEAGNGAEEIRNWLIAHGAAAGPASKFNTTSRCPIGTRASASRGGTSPHTDETLTWQSARGATSGRANAPVVVLLHAIATCSELWAAQIPVWSQFARILAVDLPGHGTSCTAGRRSTRSISTPMRSRSCWPARGSKMCRSSVCRSAE
jgi:pimeloyl-ACP methyl ester carboxylesterase